MVYVLVPFGVAESDIFMGGRKRSLRKRTRRGGQIHWIPANTL